MEQRPEIACELTVAGVDVETLQPGIIYSDYSSFLLFRVIIVWLLAFIKIQP